MRVIAGQYGGRTLHAPKGLATRPTTDRVRESLFSTLSSARGGFDDAVVLDAFAGSGALGIEALSRGATLAVFCEKDRRALEALARNTSFLEEGTARIVRGDVLRRSMQAGAPFDVVLLDPPYALDARQVAGLLGRLADEGLLVADALVSYEHDAGTVDPLAAYVNPLEWQLLSTKTFGDTSIDIYRRRP